MVKSIILTNRELEVISKKLSSRKMNQQDYNYLSRFVRPKLKELAGINAEALLKRLAYNQKAPSIENKIKKIILKQIKNPEAIIIYGSAVQRNYSDYNDIDILLMTKKKFWDKSSEKYRLISSLTENAKNAGFNLDIQIIEKKSFYSQYSRNPSLIYQLKDYKLIWGNIKLPKKINLSKIDLRMKLDWSDIVDEDSEGNEIYHAIRNTLLVRLLLNRIVDNNILHNKLVEQIGMNLLMNLKSNTASKMEKKIALKYLNQLTKLTRREILDSKWEKIMLLNR